MALGDGTRHLPARRAVPRRQPLAGRHRRHDGRHPAAARRRAPAARRAGLRARHDGRAGRARRARSTSSAGCARRSSAARGQLSDPARASCRRRSGSTSPAWPPQLPGPPVPMFVELTASRPAEPTPFPAPVDAARADDGPHLSYAVQWFIFSAAVAVGWVLAVRKSLRTRRRGVHQQPPPQPPRQSPQHRRHRPADLARRGVDAQVRRPHVDREVEEGVEERRQLVLVEAQQHLQPVGVQPPGAPQRRAARRRRGPGRASGRAAGTTARRRSPPRRVARRAARRRRRSRWRGGRSRRRRRSAAPGRRAAAGGPPTGS